MYLYIVQGELPGCTYIHVIKLSCLVYLYILFMYRELPGCTYIYYLCTGSCLGVPIYIVYVQGASWVYLYIHMLLHWAAWVNLYILIMCRELPRCTYKYIYYVQGAAWVYLLLGSAGQSEGGYTGEDRVSASSGIASGTSSQPWMEDQVRINSKKWKDWPIIF